MKTYTDLDQSRKLAEFLPLESADMYWDYDYSIYTGEYKYYPMVMDDRFDDVCIPCWSLTALFKIMSKHIKEHNVLRTDVGYDFETNGLMTESYFNPVDVCYKMILKLHGLNLL